MAKGKKVSLKERRENALYNNGFIWHGNNKLLDFDDVENGISFRYAQFNTRAVTDCPFRSAGCEAICYATKGNHVFPSVKESREKSFIESKREDFTESAVFAIRTEKESGRYKKAIMLVRIHESGDYYSVQYLRKWLRVWAEFKPADGVRFVFYTKSFPFFLMLNEQEKAILNGLLSSGIVAMNLSVDDTTSAEQWKAYVEMRKAFPLANTYAVTEHTTEEDDVCDCANCAKCGACNNARGGRKVVVIHSASADDIKTYRANKK
jgi:hypothetical protein